MALTSGTLGPWARCGFDGGVGQLGHEVALPVGPDPLGVEGIERRVQRRVGHRSHHLGHHRGQVPERLHGVLALIERPGPVDHGQTERVAVAVLGDERQGRGDLEGRETAVGLGGVFDEVPVEAQQVAGLVELVEEQPHVDVVDRVQLELEGGDHPEVAAAASQRPEQVLVLLGRWPFGPDRRR